jgi:hypothetical protein
MSEPDPALSSRIFVSYRREDTAGHVLALIPRLRNHFGADRVFKDTDSIDPGQDFLATIKRELESCSILLAIIGKAWVTIEDARMRRRRLDDPEDFLRLEVATALKNEKIRVIPVLVGRATMPPLESLPPDLAELSRRNAIELSDIRWESDVERLIVALEKVLGPPQAPAANPRVGATTGANLDARSGVEPHHGYTQVAGLLAWRTRVAAIAAALIIAVGTYVWWPKASRDGNHDILPSAPAAPTAKRSNIIQVLDAADRSAISQQVSALVAQLSTGNIANVRALYLVPDDHELEYWDHLLNRSPLKEVRATGKPDVILADADHAVATFDILMVTAEQETPFRVRSELARTAGRWRFTSVSLGEQ